MSVNVWASSADSDLDAAFNKFQSSFAVDHQLFQYEVAASIAHVTMLGRTGILKKESVDALLTALDSIRCEVNVSDLASEPNFEDIHSFVEIKLQEKIGDVAKNLHIGRSRNDQVATILKMYLRAEGGQLVSLLKDLLKVFSELAECHMTSRDGKPAIIPGYTHLQVSQPMHLSHWFLSYHDAFKRDVGRLLDAMKRMNQCPLGAAAMCGTSWPLDRFQTSAQLGFDGPQTNALDAVGARDFVAEFVAGLVIVAANLSRMSEDLLIFGTREFSFVRPSPRFSTGSSIMPQKRNADLCELTRGKAGRFVGQFVNMVTILKGLPGSYNRDLQEDKWCVIDAVEQAKSLLRLWPRYLETLEWNLDQMFTSASSSYSLATDIADELCRKGMTFRDAHGISRRLVIYCMEHHLSFTDVGDDVLATIHPYLTSDFLMSFTVEASLAGRTCLGSSGDSALRDAIKNGKAAFTQGD